MNSTPPPVQDQGSYCPNCGAYRPGNQAYCANCGYGRPVNIPQPTNNMFILWLVLFIIIGLPAGCLGGCFLLLGASSGYPVNRADIGFWALTFGGVAIFIGLLVATIMSARKRR